MKNGAATMRRTATIETARVEHHTSGTGIVTGFGACRIMISTKLQNAKWQRNRNQNVGREISWTSIWLTIECSCSGGKEESDSTKICGFLRWTPSPTEGMKTLNNWVSTSIRNILSWNEMTNFDSQFVF